MRTCRDRAKPFPVVTMAQSDAASTKAGRVTPDLSTPRRHPKHRKARAHWICLKGRPRHRLPEPMPPCGQRRARRRHPRVQRRPLSQPQEQMRLCGPRLQHHRHRQARPKPLSQPQAQMPPCGQRLPHHRHRRAQPKPLSQPQEQMLRCGQRLPLLRHPRARPTRLNRRLEQMLRCNRREAPQAPRMLRSRRRQAHQNALRRHAGWRAHDAPVRASQRREDGRYPLVSSGRLPPAEPDTGPACSPALTSVAPSASASRIFAEPGRSGLGWLSSGAHPVRKAIS